MRRLIKIAALVVALGLINASLSFSEGYAFAKECHKVSTDNVDDVFWSSDGRYIVVQTLREKPDEDFPLLQWDPNSGDGLTAIEPINSNLAWQQTPARIAWASDGSQVAFETADTVQVYENDQLVFEAPEQEDEDVYWGLLWTFDSKFLLTLTLSSIQVWDTVTWELYWQLDIDPTEELALSAQDNKFAIPARWYNEGNEVLGVEIYDIEEKQVEKRLPLDEKSLLGRRFNSLEFPIWLLDDAYILISIDQAPILPHMWNVETQEPVTINIPKRHDWDNFENLLAVVAARDDHSLEIWDMSIRQEIFTYYFDEFIRLVKWSPDGSQLAVVASFSTYVCDY